MRLRRRPSLTQTCTGASPARILASPPRAPRLGQNGRVTTTPDTLPSAALGADAWAAAHDELVGLLGDLIRIPSINPPDPPGAETEAAQHVARVLRAEGLDPEVIEPVPGRGSVVARLRSDGTGGKEGNDDQAGLCVSQGHSFLLSDQET